MTRVIKFRAWNPVDEEMHTDVCLDKQDGMVFQFLGSIPAKIIEQPNWKLMQFTGLLDKNGKEIYEGDVIRNDEIHKDIGGKVVSVLFKNGCFVGDYLGEKLYDENWEVIGNIYENPELITP